MKGLIIISVLLCASACNAGVINTAARDMTADYTPIIDFFNAQEDVVFSLYTNQGPKDGVNIPFKEFNETTLAGTTFNNNNPTIILIHGFLNGAIISTMYPIRDAYLARGDYNVIVIDWGRGAMTIDYVAARNRIPSVADCCASVSNFLLKNGYSDHDNLIIIGHSLGGQTTGLCAKRIDGQLKHIVALDPALPLFTYENTTERVDKTDAKNVHVIHTDGGLFGFMDPLGTADYYPNYGYAPQPGTEFDPTGTLSHLRACDLFAETLAKENTFIADKCTSYQFNKCTVESTGYKMGGEPLDDGNTGIYYLKTNMLSPYGRNGKNRLF